MCTGASDVVAKSWARRYTGSQPWTRLRQRTVVMPNMRTLSSVGVLGVVLWAVAPPRLQHASACSTEQAAPFEIDTSLQAQDSEPPAPFSELTAFTRRVANTRCTNNVCTSVSCNDTGTLELHFESPRDEDAGLGYKVIWLRGDMPEELRGALGVATALPNDRTIALSLSWEGVARLDGELALVAVDRAGNESVASAPVHVEWSGCTSYWDDARCGGVALRGGSGCGVVEARGGGDFLVWGLSVIAGLLVWGRARQRNS